jgi:ABC-type transporter Mla MlaB component
MSGRVVVCDATPLTRADLATVDALARLAIAARRVGRGIEVRHASDSLRQLLDLAGLAGVVPCEGSAIEVRG